PGAEQFRIDLFKGCWEYRVQQLVSSNLADHFLCRPPVELLRAAIPVRDDIVHITDENGVVREVEETSLLAQDFERLAPFDHQTGNDQRGSQEGNQGHEVQRVV